MMHYMMHHTDASPLCDCAFSLSLCSPANLESVLPLSLLCLSRGLIDSQSHTHIHSLSFVLVAVMKSKELKTKIYPHAHSLILSPQLSFPTIPVYTHTHTLIITLHCTCGYDEIKGTQDF